MTSSNRTLIRPDAAIAFDVHEPTAASDHRALVMIGQPMAAEGFAALAAAIADRTVVTYDPRGLGRSTRADGSRTNDPGLQAEDLHALIAELGRGPVDMFATSGGAVTGLALASAYSEDLRLLVAHEPPLLSMLPDAQAAFAAEDAVREAYQARGFGAGMATFILLASRQGDVEGFDAGLPAEPASFGLPTVDDGSRDDPLLSGASSAVTAYQPDIEALKASSVRLVIAAGADSGESLAARCARALAERLSTQVVVFPGGHAGFLPDGGGQRGDPLGFAARLLETLSSAERG